jgi:hypothetical protein
MHCSARRAGYPSDSSRAERQQTRTRPAGGGPLLYDYAVDRLRHLHQRSRPHCTRAVSPPAHHPVPALAGTHRHAAIAGPGEVPLWHRSRAAAVVRALCPASDYSSPSGGPAAAIAPGRRCEPGPAPYGPSSVRGPACRLTVPHVADCRVAARAPRRPDRRTALPSQGRAPYARTWAVGAVPGPGPPWSDRLGRLRLCGACEPAGPRAMGRHPGLPPDSAQMTTSQTQSAISHPHYNSMYILTFPDLNASPFGLAV